VQKIYKLKSNANGDCSFLLYPGSFAMMLVSLFYLKVLKKQKVFIEKNELMYSIALNYPIKKVYSIKLFILILIKTFLVIIGFIQDILTPFFSGIIAISNNIENIYKNFNSQIIQIPILCSRYNNLQNFNPTGTFSIGYTGDINQNKDGILSFIKVLGKLGSKENFIFYLWGSRGSNSQFIQLTKTVDKLGLSNKIIFNGFIKEDQIKYELSKMDLLVLPRPLNMQTKYGFSTKLGEYMMSGKPVLTTDVSDNSLYIKDGINGFIIKNNNEQTMLKKITEILNLKKETLENIGNEGRITACLYFDTMKHAESLNSFLFQ
jgi:glycosyltransferase involved in cell wall biosynthesis